MASPPEHWIAHHFSLANPKGRRQGDLARLLRNVAQEVEALGDAEVYDLVLHTETTSRGPWYSVTVYYARPDDEP
jgi:hypothetical protein